MLRIFGSPTMLCDGLTRRDLLHAGEVRNVPVSPKDTLATAFHPLGIDAQRRPAPIAGDGKAWPEVFA